MKRNIIKKGEAWIMLLLSFFLFALSAVTDHYWLVFVCFIPLLASLEKITRLKTKLLAGFLFGLLYFSLASFWTQNVNMFIFGAVVIYQSFFMVLFAYGHHLLTRKAKGRFFPYLNIACLWVGIEYLRSLGYLGLPIGLVGYQLIENLCLIQSASIFGIYGLSFFVFLVNVLLFLSLDFTQSCAVQQHCHPDTPSHNNGVEGSQNKIIEILRRLWLLRMTRQENRKRIQRLGLLGAVLGLLAANFIYGKHALSHSSVAEGPTIAVIQANIKPDRKWDVNFIEHHIAKHEKLSRLALQEKPDLIVWPETAVTCFLLHPQRKNLLDRIKSFSRDIQTPLLIGTLDIKIDASGKSAFNSAILISKEGRVIGKYDKIKLVPFVEKAPVKALIPSLRKIEGLMPIYEPGQRLTQFKNKERSFSTIICFEALFPGLVRQFVKKGAQWIVNITNDEPALGDRHFYYEINANMTIIRAIENRRSFIRAANTGISMVIDPFGRVSQQLPVGEEGYFSASVPVSDAATPYSRFGDLIVFFSIASVMIGLLRKP